MSIEEKDQRWKRVNVCAECIKHKATCGKGTVCEPIRKKLHEYAGIKFTSDGFDCALPVSIDSHSVCSFGCLYCFAPNLLQRREEYNLPISQTSLSRVEQLFSGSGGESFDMFRRALKYNKKINGYPCPIQLGALTDPLDNIERNQGWFLKFMELAKKYNQPVRISTKGNLFLEDEYLNAVADRPELFWVMFSIISADDKIIRQVDKRAPPTSERIECMRRLSEVGVKTGLRFRPIIPGISDSTPDYPQAWKTLIEMAAEAGAKSISYEVAFIPGCMTPEIKERWHQVELISGKPLVKIYKSFGKSQSCIRPSYKWTEQIMHAIHNEAKKHNLQIGVSDPVWKQLSECGCCCGITEDDPVFGNWQRESATNQLLKAKNTGCLLCAKDIIPEWAYENKLENFICPSVGPFGAWAHRHGTWADKLRDFWNNIEKERSTLNYFQGALKPVKNEDGELYYKYEGLKRSNKKNTPFWNIRENKKS